MKGFMYALVGSHQCGEAGGKLTRNKTSYVIGFRNIFGFFSLVLSWKQDQKIGKWVIIGQVLTILGQLLERYGQASWKTSQQQND